MAPRRFVWVKSGPNNHLAENAEDAEAQRKCRRMGGFSACPWFLDILSFACIFSFGCSQRPPRLCVLREKGLLFFLSSRIETNLRDFELLPTRKCEDPVFSTPSHGISSPCALDTLCPCSFHAPGRLESVGPCATSSFFFVWPA